MELARAVFCVKQRRKQLNIGFLNVKSPFHCGHNVTLIWWGDMRVLPASFKDHFRQHKGPVSGKKAMGCSNLETTSGSMLLLVM